MDRDRRSIIGMGGEGIQEIGAIAIEWTPALKHPYLAKIMKRLKLRVIQNQNRFPLLGQDLLPSVWRGDL